MSRFVGNRPRQLEGVSRVPNPKSICGVLLQVGASKARALLALFYLEFLLVLFDKYVILEQFEVDRDCSLKLPAEVVVGPPFDGRLGQESLDSRVVLTMCGSERE